MLGGSASCTGDGCAESSALSRRLPGDASRAVPCPPPVCRELLGEASRAAGTTLKSGRSLVICRTTALKASMLTVAVVPPAVDWEVDSWRSRKTQRCNPKPNHERATVHTIMRTRWGARCKHQALTIG